MTTLSDLIEKSAYYDTKKADFVASQEYIYFDEQANIVVPRTLFGDVPPMEMNHNAFSQACEKLGVPLSYMEKCPPELRAHNMNYWRGDKRWMVRSYDGVARAILSNEYVPIYNTWVLEAAAELLGSTPYKLVRPYVDQDRMYVKIMFAENPGGNYGAGVLIRNGEVGDTAVRLAPFIQRTSCENSTVWQDGGFEQRHWKVTLAFLKGAIKEKLGQIFSVSLGMLEKVVEAEMDEIPDVGKTIADLCKQHGFSQDIQENMLIGTEGFRSRGGVAHGFAYAAKYVDNIEQAARLESLAGAWLMGGQ